MLGMYGDNAQSMERTINLSLSEPFDIVNYSVSAPYPGTGWGEIASGKGWIKDTGWKAYDQNYSAQVDQPGCPRELVRKFQRRAYFSWYLSYRGLKFFLNGFRPEYFSYFFSTAKEYLLR